MQQGRQNGAGCSGQVGSSQSQRQAAQQMRLGSLRGAAPRGRHSRARALEPEKWGWRGTDLTDDSRTERLQEEATDTEPSE